jgi:hypothetical protein
VCSCGCEQKKAKKKAQASSTGGRSSIKNFFQKKPKPGGAPAAQVCGKTRPLRVALIRVTRFQNIFGAPLESAVARSQYIVPKVRTLHSWKSV